MTFALLAFCPWSFPNETSQGLAFVTDSHLTGVNLLTGGTRLMSNHERKIFDLGPFAVGAYCGSQISARAALNRVRPLLEHATKLPGGLETSGRIRRLIYQGARQAERHARYRKRPFRGGAFEVLIGYVDARRRLNAVTVTDGDVERFKYAHIKTPDGFIAIQLLGAGAEGAMPYFKLVDGLVGTAWPRQTEITETTMSDEAGYLAIGLWELLRQHPVDGCGGGVQLMTLDAKHGAVRYRFWSQAALDSYYPEQWGWQPHLPSVLSE